MSKAKLAWWSVSAKEEQRTKSRTWAHRNERRVGARPEGQSLYRRETNEYCACHIEDSHSYSVQYFCILGYTLCILVQYIDTKVLHEVEASIIVADQEVGLIWKWRQYARICFIETESSPQCLKSPATRVQFCCVPVESNPLQQLLSYKQNSFILIRNILLTLPIVSSRSQFP
jgi:hypothetical protein